MENVDEEEDLLAPEGEDLTDNEEVDAVVPKKPVIKPGATVRLKRLKESDVNTDSVGGDVVKIVPKFKKKGAGKKAGKVGKKGAKTEQVDGGSSQGESDAEEGSQETDKKKMKIPSTKKCGAKMSKKTTGDKDSSESEAGDEEAQSDSETSKKKKPGPKKGNKVTKGAKQKKTAAGKSKKSDSGVESEGDDSQASGKGKKKITTNVKDESLLSPGDSSDDDIPLKVLKDAGTKKEQKATTKGAKKKILKKDESKMEVESDEDEVPLTSLVKKEEEKEVGDSDEDKKGSGEAYYFLSLRVPYLDQYTS